MHELKIIPPPSPDTGRDRRLARLAELDPRPELLSLGADRIEAELGEWLVARGEPSYRVGQVVQWVYRQRVDGWDAMTTLPAALRAALASAFRFPSIALEEERRSKDGTEKILWRLLDGEAVESVLIPSPGRDTFCVSSQAGCALACAFCATGMFGFRRNLTVGEIVDQVRHLQRRREDVGHGANVVFMGMGEPLLNWENLRAALALLVDERYLDVGARRITVSTVGVPDKIVALGDEFPQVRLAVSLHAAIDELRDRIVPLNRRYPLRQLLAACRLWCEATGKRMTFEYLHLPGVNDRPEDVAALARVVDGLSVQINLMRYNPIPGADFRRPSVTETERFRDRLRREIGAPVTIRRSRGLDIEGACGQLRLARGGSAVPTSGEADG
ncbi:MAG TPA: 23S rRNA (adenine(2503)-C(2))-methyltransferase RlmN [Gemmatimonadota bacterium]|nr:23S rRNA (adenine(2503)-C(2))-methyltransferase RlmN [Gemmatimonadota bacterium]